MTKKKGYIFGAAFLVVIVVVSILTFQRSQPTTTTEEAEGPKIGEEKIVPEFAEKGPGKRDDWFMTQKGYEQGDIPRNAFQKAFDQTKQIRANTAKEAPGALDQTWTFNAPSNVGGRVVDVVVDPNNEDTIYIAAASGGVWKSTDAGATFKSAWDDDLVQSLGALAITSDGTLYAGTGEANPGGGSVVYGGTGVYKSTDGGESWEYSGLKDSNAIGRIVVDPSNPNKILVAATGPLFHDGGERGLYVTEDGGETWELVLEGANATTGAIDIALDSQNPDRIYVAMWDRIRYPNERKYGGEGSGIYRSEDGGASWTQLTEGLPAGEQVGRIGLAVSSTDADKVYATVIKTDGHFEGFYVSENAGGSWEKQPHHDQLADSQSSFGWWFGRNYVDPNDGNHLFVSGVRLMESTDGGQTWTRSGRGIHADQHAMAWDPNKPDRVYLGNDGGLYRSEDDGSLESDWVKAEHQPFTQFYTLDVSRQDRSRLSGGTQDNGSIRSWGDGNEGWNNYYYGDGLVNLINYENQDIVYACYQYGNCARSEDGGKTMTYFTHKTESERRNWLTPVVFDPNDPSIMYYGGNIVNRSTDGGKTWDAISPSLSDAKSNDQYPFGTITTIAVSKSNPNVLFAGTDDGRVWTTKDLGENWQEIEDPKLPDRWVTRLAVDPKDEDIVYATFSGFRSGDNGAHVLKSDDGGESWVDISGNLPNVPLNDLVINPKKRHVLYAASDVGVFVSPNGGKKWYTLGEGIPVVPVTDLKYHQPSDVLYAATFGRGVYEVELKGW
ncbi:hypothetical protein [Alkalihalobacillus sp. AL-G]|uniref:WD40/YVTN/BNR-like repeat-containing protein n=1 Tax=Alkalihalobacillus sp. AL-G TaxID=2926399 RepID=UPI00272D400D|nr:hypothetical protein [Alkalihalobacillus sp. AL-G]WLD94458.1 hypothetical protein MOJ78_06095 [Alkalihalobacillus sp. AL-G]